MGPIEAQAEGTAGDALTSQRITNQPARVDRQTRVGMKEHEMAPAGALRAQLQLKPAIGLWSVDPDHAFGAREVPGVGGLLIGNYHELALAKRHARGPDGAQ